MAANTWKLQDAKAQFSEVVRRARAGEPQEVTVHGEEAVRRRRPHEALRSEADASES